MAQDKRESSGDAINELFNEEKTPGCYIKARHVLAGMGFLGLFWMQAMRSSLSIAIVAMVNSTSENTTSNTSCPDRGASEIDEVTTNGEFDWDATQQGLVLGCYFYGYIISNLPGGWIAKRYGFCRLLSLSMFLSSLLTLLSPIMAYTSFELFVTGRIILGFVQGITLPAYYAAWGEWAPPMERSVLLSFQFSAYSVGSFVTLPIAGLIADTLGWEAVFYVTGVGSLLWTVAWFAMMYDLPEKHPRISDQEKNYIVKSIGEQRAKDPRTETRTPWRAIFTSLPVWAIVISHFTNYYQDYVISTLIPTYMSTVLKFNLASSGALSAVPYIPKFLFTLFAGYFTDVLLRRGVVSTAAIRKINTMIAHCVSALFLVLVGYVGCDIAAAVSFFTISLTVDALAVPGAGASPVDIAPKYVGITFGIVNTIANISGFLGPQISGLILQGDNSISQWQIVFWVSAILNSFGGIVFLIFGSGVEQPWAAGKVTMKGTGKKVSNDSDAKSEERYTRL